MGAGEWGLHCRDWKAAEGELAERWGAEKGGKGIRFGTRGVIRPTLEILVTLPSGGAASLAASAACPLLIE